MTGQRNQTHYKQLVQDLKFFFNIRIFALIISTVFLILFVNGLQNVTVVDAQIAISQNTKQHISYLFYETEKQALFTSRLISRIVEKQYNNMEQYGEMFYRQNQAYSSVQKMVFKDKYNTTGQFTCINGECTSLSFYLKNLWSKRIYHASIKTLYFSYYDPLQNTSNIAYTPSNSNKLSNEQISDLFATCSQKVALHKFGENIYLSVSSHFNTSFSPTFNVKAAIQLNKQQFKQTLQMDIQLNSFYEYELRDSLGWISFKSTSQVPVLSSSNGFSTTQISYISKTNNQTLITFQFKILNIKIFFNFLKLTVLLPILLLAIQILNQRQIYHTALRNFFSNTQRLISLYEYNIQQIFTANNPKPSTILNNTSTTQFYQQLSQIPSPEYQPIKHKIKEKILPKGFLFVQIIKEIVQKYNIYARNIFRQKNRQIINNKFFIHSSVNEISESESLKIKQALTKSKQLGLIQHFFKFAYLAILLDPVQFDISIQRDTSPLPEQHIKLIRQINRTVCGKQVRKAFKLSTNVRKQTEEQLQMRIQINLLQKYIQILKDLDIHNVFAKQLGLQRDLQNVNQYIQNIKHVLNKHNKNIRTMGK